MLIVISIYAVVTAATIKIVAVVVEVVAVIAITAVAAVISVLTFTARHSFLFGTRQMVEFAILPFAGLQLHGLKTGSRMEKLTILFAPIFVELD